jgi:nicotinate-nucleotide adenylyltransferase
VGVQPLKTLAGSASYEDRLEMTRLAIQGEVGFEISTLDEPVSDKPNFTAETLERLAAKFMDGTKLFCLMGADSFLQLSSWHRASELPFLAELIVAARPGEVLEPMGQHLPPGVELEHGPLRLDEGQLLEWSVRNESGKRAVISVLPNLHYEVSATELRAAIQNHKQRLLNGDALLSTAVLDYIHSHKLYQ